MELNTKQYLNTVSEFSNGNSTFSSSTDMSDNVTMMMILQSIISSVGITANLTVVAVFLNDRKLRVKIPNMCIINQVSIKISIFALFHFCRVKRPSVFQSKLNLICSELFIK